MKENEQATVNNLSTLSKIMTLKTKNLNLKEEDEKSNINALNHLNKIIKPSQEKKQLEKKKQK